MPAFHLTPAALRDIDRIWGFIARDNVGAADRVYNAIFDACELLGRNSSLGHSNVHLTRLAFRFWTLAEFPNYIIAYRKVRAGVQIVRVVHGRRNLRRVLKF